MARGTAERTPRPRSAGVGPASSCRTALSIVVPPRTTGTGFPSDRNQTLVPAPAALGSASADATSARKALHFMAIGFDVGTSHLLPRSARAGRTSSPLRVAPMRDGRHRDPSLQHLTRAGRRPARDDDARNAASLALVESYRRLADVFHDVLSEQSLDAVLERIADTIAELIPHDDLAFYEADEANRLLRGVLARGEYADEVLADEPFALRASGSRAGPSSTGSPCSRTAPTSTLASRFVEGTPPDPESLIAVPLIARGRIKGALNIYRVGLRKFTEEELQARRPVRGRCGARARQRARHGRASSSRPRPIP